VHDFKFDGKANQLREWALDERRGILCVCADTATFFQIRAFLTRFGAISRPAPFSDAEATRWTHCLSLSLVPDELRSFLLLLSRVLVLQGLPPQIDDAIALDFYKIPVPDRDPDDWPNTPVGELVARMKYWTSDPVSQDSAQADLVARLADVVVHHPAYRDSRLVSVPGHDSTAPSRSERLAQALAKHLGVPLARTRARTLVRPAAKNRSDRVDFRGEFTLDPSEVGRSPVLIIDDVLGRGTTMAGVAQAARQAASPRIHGLVAARTIR